MRLSVAAVALGAACWLGGVPIVRASETITIDGAVREALANNPDLLAARHAIDMARGRLRQAGLWPNPDLELEGSDDFLFSREGERGFSSGFAQRFPIARRLGKAKVRFRFAQELHHLIVNNLDDLLPGRDARENFPANRTLPYVVNELSCHLKIHVGIQEHPPYFPEGLCHVFFCNLPVTPKLLEHGFEFLAESFEHVEWQKKPQNGANPDFSGH